MDCLQFYIDGAGKRTELVHYWEMCVGACHGYTALREDYRIQLRKAREELGFRYVRFHGLLNDDMSVVRETAPGKYEYNFVNIDNIFDFLMEIGMKPFLEISFMPSPLASGDQTCFYYKGNVTMPKSFALWEDLIRELMIHLSERYGLKEMRQWFFEVWNEPNLDFFFAGSQKDYFTLYAHTARVIKSLDPELKVGGPATANNQWIPDFLEYCRKNRVPVDFVSTHHYPSDDPCWNEDMHLDDFFDESERRGILTKMVKIAASEAGELPLYYTEWNTSANEGDEFHDTPYSAALVLKTLIDNQSYVKGYSFWTFSDIFEEHGQVPGEFRGGFGLQTIHGIPKPVYRAFELLHRLGTEQLPAVAEKKSVGVFAASGRAGGLCILAYNQDMVDKPIEDYNVSIYLKNVTGTSAVIFRIDETHANAKRLWEEMGKPVYPSLEQIGELKENSMLREEILELEETENGVRLTFELPAYGVALIEIR